MSRFDLVIFDCDGVLVDSERITNQIFCDMLNEIGLHVTLEDMFEHFVGRSMQQCIDQITEMRGTPPPESFVPLYRFRSTEALKKEIKPIHGIHETLDNLTIPYCVASSGEYQKMRLTLGATGLLDRFDGRIFSVADVKRSKPAPDIYLYAAKKMGAEPTHCAVVEDTPTGVQAAVTAGMYVFGFSANSPEHRLKEAGAHKLFSDMHVFPQLLNNAQITAQTSLL